MARFSWEGVAGFTSQVRPNSLLVSLEAGPCTTLRPRERRLSRVLPLVPEYLTASLHSRSVPRLIVCRLLDSPSECSGALKRTRR